MELWYSLVIGTVVFFYVHFFNANAKAWLGSDKQMPFTIESMLGYTHRESNPGQSLGRASFYH